MKCLIFWTFVALLAMCASAEGPHHEEHDPVGVNPREDNESVGVDHREELESVRVDTGERSEYVRVPAAKPKPTPEPCRKTMASCSMDSQCCSRMCRKNHNAGYRCM